MIKIEQNNVNIRCHGGVIIVVKVDSEVRKEMKDVIVE